MRERGLTGIIAWLALLALPVAATAAGAPHYLAEVMNPDLTGGREVPAGDGSTLLLWGTDATILRSDDGQDWQHARTPGSADLAQLDSNESGSVLIAVGAKTTILRSTDAGRTWSTVKLPAVVTDFTTVAYAGEQAWVAAGTGGRILRSIDDGRSWTLIESSLSATLRTLKPDAESGLLFIGGDDGLIGFSEDRGESWSVTAINMPEPITPVTAFHRFGALMLATSARGRFLMSNDGGESWDLLQSTSTAYFMGAAHDAKSGLIVMTGHDGDVLRSSDDGQNWETAEVLVDGSKSFLGAVVYDERAQAFFAIGQAGVILRSLDGANWEPATRALRTESRGLLRDSRGTLITFGVGGLVAQSTNAGGSWTIAREPFDYPIRELLKTPRGDALIATSRLGDVLRSTDGGRRWQVVTPVYPNVNTPPDLRGLVVTPSREALVAAGPPGAILRGNADGTAWHVVVWHEIEAERAYPWVLVDHERKRLLAIEARGALRVSGDDGENWTLHDLPVDLRPGQMPFWYGAVLESKGVMLVTGEGGRAARSDDGGSTWRLVETGTRENLYGSFAVEATGRLFLAGARGTLLSSDDGGATWTATKSVTDQELRRFHRDPHSNTLLCFGAHGTLLLSRDDGKSWRVIPSGTEGVLREAMTEPGTRNLLIVGGQGTLLRSTDAGRRWQKLDTHSQRHFTSIAADDAGNLVLAGERIVRLVKQSPRGR